MSFADHDLSDVPALAVAYYRQEPVIAITPMRLERDAVGDQVRHAGGRSARQALLSWAAGVELGRVETHDPNALVAAADSIPVDRAAALLGMGWRGRQQQDRQRQETSPHHAAIASRAAFRQAVMAARVAFAWVTAAG